MTRLRLTPGLLFASSLFAHAAFAAPALEVRFYPDRALRLHELNGQRGVFGALLQNAAIVNRGDAPVTIDEAVIELVGGGTALQTHRIAGPALEAVATRSGRLAASGMVEMFAFHFQPPKLLAGAKPVGSTTLAPGEAILVGQRVLTIQGAGVERLRFSARGHDAAGDAVSGAGELPVESGGSKNVYGFPLAGNWFVGAGASFHSHHRWVVPEEFALDIARLGEGGTTHKGAGATNADHFAWEQPVRAVADGTVAAVVTKYQDSDEYLRKPGESLEAYNGRVQQQQGALFQQGLEAIGGNAVTIAHANGEFSHSMHLRAGSITVKVGDTVKRGQQIAKLGNTGNSTEPHLHFQVTDGADPLNSIGLPVTFDGIEILWADSPRALQTGDVVEAQ